MMVSQEGKRVSEEWEEKETMREKDENRGE
jgi:hypothetical protein